MVTRSVVSVVLHGPHQASHGLLLNAKFGEDGRPGSSPRVQALSAHPGGVGFKPQLLTLRGAVPRHVPRKRTQEGGDTEARCPRVSGCPTGWRGGEQKHLFGGARNVAGSVGNLHGGLLGCFRNCMQSSWVLAKSIPWLPKLYPALHGHPSLAADGWSSFPEE